MAQASVRAPRRGEEPTAGREPLEVGPRHTSDMGLRSGLLAMLLLMAAACGTTPGDGFAKDSSSTTVETSTATLADGPRDDDGNLVEGDGWRLIAFTRSGLTYGVAVAENAADLDRIWERLAFELDPPVLDFTTQVLMVLGHAVSGSCPEIQFQGLVVTSDRAYGTFTFDHDRNACNADANPAAYLLAVDRVALPDVFQLTLEAEDICGGCDEDTITVDLTNEQPDDSQWWARGRFAIVLGGAPPEDSHVFTMHFGSESQPLAILASDWQVEHRWMMGSDQYIPDRVEAFTAHCIGGGECIEDLDLIEPTGPVCATDISMVPRQDLAVVITFADDGSCHIELVPGSDGREYG